MKRSRLLIALLPLFLTYPARGEDLLSFGKKIAMAGNGQKGSLGCMECHALNGQGMPAIGSPRIAGQDAHYIDHELHGVQNGTRYAPIMAGVVNTLSAREIRAVALYYASLTAPASPDSPRPDPKLVSAGEKIARRGLWARNIPACDLCHGPGGRGIPPHFPYIAGQNAPYLLRQLVSFAVLKRRDDPQGLMRGISGRMTMEERTAVAAYFSSLSPPPSAIVSPGSRP